VKTLLIAKEGAGGTAGIEILNSRLSGERLNGNYPPALWTRNAWSRVGDWITPSGNFIALGHLASLVFSLAEPDLLNKPESTWTHLFCSNDS
jgi:hypothetical protein